MGGLVGGLFDLFGGNPAEKEQQQFGNLANYETGVGEPLTTAGAGFEEAILSGDPSRISQALAPEISAGQKQVEQQALQNANFGNRAGGTNASTQAAEAGERGNIINLIGGLQSGTAGAAVGQGSGLLGQASSNVGSEAQLAEQRRQQQLSDVSGIASDIGAIASPFLGGKGGAGAGTPGSTVGLQQAGNATPLLTDDELGINQGFYQQPLEQSPYFAEL